MWHTGQDSVRAGRDNAEHGHRADVDLSLPGPRRRTLYTADALRGMHVDAADEAAMESSLTRSLDALPCIKAHQLQLRKTCSSQTPAFT